MVLCRREIIPDNFKYKEYKEYKTQSTYGHVRVPWTRMFARKIFPQKTVYDVIEQCEFVYWDGFLDGSSQPNIIGLFFAQEHESRVDAFMKTFSYYLLF